MKLHVRVFWSLMAMALLATACAGGDQGTEPAPSPDVVVEPAATEVAASAAAEVAPAVVVTDDELIAAAVAQIEADVAAGQGPAGAIAYDVLDTSVANGNVTLTICAWDGETVFDSVLAALYRTSVDSDGAVTASLITAPVAPGACVNTQLIDTALDFIDEYEVFWTDVTADPSSYRNDQRSSSLHAAAYEPFAQDLVAQFELDNLQYEAPYDRVDGIVADLLFRRFRVDGQSVLELVICRSMNRSYGAYRDGVLVDRNQASGDPGLHSVIAYELVVEEGNSGQLVLTGSGALVWSDCFGTGDWPAAANGWRPLPTALEVLPR